MKRPEIWMIFAALMMVFATQLLIINKMNESCNVTYIHSEGTLEDTDMLDEGKE
ncbi:hypothetical protein UFOVP855_30 [uncultured Caudovirales phage]|uniref:Uncharacterized protein n=2 Tax=uncultured Caudovirales phage TaxID=2100421 RepID=A0A6J5SZ60_9CAUD|nr:hypothetical protein UFOVP527_7 [uncultured Caudovirales phage]CAB4167583.1 hypothetical protein UFOVP855_30 [uncultured Caudovirales phage]CAB4173603.1 hypothetical protein UFOVP954_44 [uncultured Caudovirales phage]CAB4178962.1 hypothetical protein UFOVP1026_17 [uncultured Caudovirales phage]CAB4220246.1 hypothetical protein UFOVP1629_2 [uncultured Caudovirales phage]